MAKRRQMDKEDLYRGALGPIFETALFDLGTEENKSGDESSWQEVDKAFEEAHRVLQKVYRVYQGRSRFLKESFYLRGFNDGRHYSTIMLKRRFNRLLRKLRGGWS